MSEQGQVKRGLLRELLWHTLKKTVLMRFLLWNGLGHLGHWLIGLCIFSSVPRSPPLREGGFKKDVLLYRGGVEPPLIGKVI